MNTTMPTIGVTSGGGFTETSLWTNPAPTSSFGAQTITLSDDMTKYDYLKFRFKWQHQNIDTELPSIIVATSQFVNTASGTMQTRLVAPCVQGTSSTVYTDREIYRASNTTIGFTQGTSANISIPLEVIGLKA